MPKREHITARQVFEKACTYISQDAKDSPDLEKYTPAWLDVLVQEALGYENARRRYEADPLRPVLKAAPVVAGLDMELPYDDEICRVALPYGLASQFFLDDQDMYNAQDFRSRFIAALMDTQRVRGQLVEDVY